MENPLWSRTPDGKKPKEKKRTKSVGDIVKKKPIVHQPGPYLNRLQTQIVVNMKFHFRTFLFKSFIRKLYYYVTFSAQSMRTKPVHSYVTPRKEGCLE